MGPLKNTKHETFVLGVFDGKPGRQAYRDAGYQCEDAAADVGASRLLKSAKVAARLAELQAKVAAKVVLSKSVVIENVHRLANLAEAKEQLGVSKGCWELLGKEFGAFKEHRKITVRSIAELTEEELLDELARLKSPDAETVDNRPGKRAAKTQARKKPARRLGDLIN
jgi:hypothetical protein